MATLKKIWSPVTVYPGFKSSCELMATHTMAISVFLIGLIVHLQNGKESTQMYNTFFETNLGEFNPYAICGIVFFVYMIGSSLLLLKGLYNNIRGFLLPWLIGLGLAITFLLVWPIWLLIKYYIHIYIICAAVIYWILAALHLYCWLCVYTQYLIYAMQSLTIELLII